MDKNKFVFLGVSLILLGIFLGQLEILDLIKAGLLGLLVISTSGIGLFVGYFNNTEKLTQVSLQTIGSTVVLGVSLIISLSFKSVDQTTAVNKVMLSINQYKETQGTYPKCLEELGISNTTNKYFYKTDSLQKEFELSYSVDGWHIYEYSSKSKQWSVTD